MFSRYEVAKNNHLYYLVRSSKWYGFILVFISCAICWRSTTHFWPVDADTSKDITRLNSKKYQRKAPADVQQGINGSHSSNACRTEVSNWTDGMSCIFFIPLKETKEIKWMYSFTSIMNMHPIYLLNEESHKLKISILNSVSPNSL